MPGPIGSLPTSSPVQQTQPSADTPKSAKAVLGGHVEKTPNLADAAKAQIATLRSNIERIENKSQKLAQTNRAQAREIKQLKEVKVEKSPSLRRRLGRAIFAFTKALTSNFAKGFKAIGHAQSQEMGAARDLRSTGKSILGGLKAAFGAAVTAFGHAFKSKEMDGARAQDIAREAADKAQSKIDQWVETTSDALVQQARLQQEMSSYPNVSARDDGRTCR